MKRKIKSLLALLLIFSMFLGMTTNSIVFAEDVSEDFISEEMTIEVEGVKTIETVQQNELLLNYLCVGEVSLRSLQEQSILISLGDGNETVSNMKLYVMKDNGTVEALQVADCTDNIYRFTRTYNNNESGVYTVNSLTYEIGEELYTIDMNEIGIQAQYSVDMESVVSEEANDEITDDIKEEVEASLVELDNLTTEAVSEEIGTVLGNTEENMNSDVGIVSYSLDESDATFSGTQDGQLVVVLDPGHGGSDSGAVGNGLYEKDLTLKIAKYVKEELEQYCSVTVYMTREDDTYVGLAERVEMAAAWNADVFVSIHLNSAVAEAKGAEVYYPNSSYNYITYSQGKGLAQEIQDRLVELGLYDRGIKYKDATDGGEYDDGSIMDYYSVIRNSKMSGFPGIIVEHAFISNSSDASKLKSESFLKQLGVADATGIAEYYFLSKTDYSPIFNYQYYLENNPDVAKACGSNERSVVQHFLVNGMKEGRRASSEFDAKYYKNHYLDLQEKYGDDMESYYWHYLNTGIAEGRVGAEITDPDVPDGTETPTEPDIPDGTETPTEPDTPDGTETPTEPDTSEDKIERLTIYNGVDYSLVYDYDYYLEQNTDVKNAYKGDEYKTLQHFVLCGMKEKRVSSVTFDINFYSKKYSDLKKAFGTDWAKYYLHYINSGYREGRIATGTISSEDALTIYEGIDYALVYDYAYYLEKNPDVKSAYKGDEYKTLRHFVLCGMKEGRTSSETFDINFYYAKYPDLRQTYGTNWEKYYLHYIKSGYREGRVATGTITALVRLTTYNGVNYSLVYDYDYYLEKNPDVKNAYKGDEYKTLQHFVLCGMKEKRTASENFDIHSYINAYADLRKAYGTNWNKYYLHYIKSGYKEGRITTGVNTLKNAVTSYNGTDYSAVYDFQYYIEQNSDIKKKYQYDDAGALAYFVEYGMNKGQQAKETFNVSVYKNNYADLRKAFGDNLKKYYMHYISYGEREGRKAY